MFTLGILVALGKTEINDVDVVLGALCVSNQKVVRLYVPMNNAFFMNFLDALNHLNRNMQACLQIKLSSTFLEKIFKRFAEQIHDHNVVHFSVFGLLIANKVQIRN